MLTPRRPFPAKPRPRYRTLTEEEAERFRRWARRHRPSWLLDWEAYHPVCRDEWRLLGIGPTRPELAAPED